MGFSRTIWDLDENPNGNVQHFAEHSITNRTMKRVTRDRHLTGEEAAKYDAVREEVEQEKPEINARIRRRMAAKRKAEADQWATRTLGRRIRSAREALGESQVSLAASAGISQGYLSQLETDEREPTLSIAARLAEALGITLDELASGVA